MGRRVVGAFARALNSIPVVRPQDLTKTCTGRIYLPDRDQDPRLIRGIGTTFTKEFGPRSILHLPSKAGSAQVEAVLSDTELRLKEPFSNLSATNLLRENEGTVFKATPHVDQNELFNTVYEQLAAGNCVGLFPEGGSHDRTELLPLKAGVTVMALGAMSRYPGLDVKIVPCGLSYFHPHRFRSRAVVEFGEPITVPKELVDMYASGGEQKRQACSTLLDTIYNSLKSITVTTPDYETLMLIQAARRLYKPAERKLTTTQVISMTRLFVKGYNIYKDDPRVKALSEKVTEYNKTLRHYGIRDHQVKNTAIGGVRAFQLLMYRLALGLVFLAVSLPGVILLAPVIYLIEHISSLKQKESLATSTVKLRGKDVVSSWKVIVALILLPTINTFYSTLSFLLAYLHFSLPLSTSLFKVAVPVFVAFPFMSYATVRTSEVGVDIFKSLRPLFLSLVWLEGGKVEGLRVKRAELEREVVAVIEEIGPTIMEDFEKGARFIGRRK
ncbi:hypothetical protein HK102_009652, partial [Quaeritorhiza haematococci]